MGNFRSMLLLIMLIITIVQYDSDHFVVCGIVANKMGWTTSTSLTNVYLGKNAHKSRYIHAHTTLNIFKTFCRLKSVAHATYSSYNIPFLQSLGNDRSDKVVSLGWETGYIQTTKQKIKIASANQNTFHPREANIYLSLSKQMGSPQRCQAWQ